MNMGQWFVQWGWTLASLVVSAAMAMIAYRQAQSLIVKSGGDWRKAILYVFGPFVAFCIMIALMAVTFPWAIGTIYGAVQQSAVSQSFYQLGVAGVSALGGTFTTAEIQIPEAPSLGGLLSENIPSEADLRNVLVGGNGGQQSAPANKESAAPAPNAQSSTTWTAPASAPAQLPLVMAPAILNGETKAYAPPAVPLVLQSAADKTPVAQPTSIPFIFKAAGNDGGGPLAADADAAIANAGATTYTVKRGDYLSKIATQVDVPASVICRANRLPDCNNLRTGTVLTIPAQ